MLAEVNWFIESHTEQGIKTPAWDSENLGLTKWSPLLKYREIRAFDKQLHHFRRRSDNKQQVCDLSGKAN